jgi:hypothetical protein
LGSKEEEKKLRSDSKWSKKMELIQLYSNHFIKTARKFYQGKSMKLRKGMDNHKQS